MYSAPKKKSDLHKFHVLTLSLIHMYIKFHTVNCRAIKGKGGGVKALPLREQKPFVFHLLPFKNKNYFTLDNLSQYHDKVCR